MNLIGIISDGSNGMEFWTRRWLVVVVFLALQCKISPLLGQEEKIFWTDSLEFSWDLFKEKSKGYGYMKAMTHSGIMYDVDVENGQVVIDVKAYFIYGKSWVMKGYKKPELLAHEQLHFHIAEIYSRKLDQICDAYRVGHREFTSENFMKKLQRDFNRIFDEMDAYQQLYDSETQHGTITSKQREWKDRITRQLNSTEKN